MKSRDKLDQYIKKEIESISYMEEDRMWDDFQKKHTKDLAKWDTPRYLRALFFGSIFLFIMAVAMFFFAGFPSLLNDKLATPLYPNREVENSHSVNETENTFTETDIKLDTLNQIKQSLAPLVKEEIMEASKNNADKKAKYFSHYNGDKVLKNGQQILPNQTETRSSEKSTLPLKNTTTQNYGNLPQKVSAGTNADNENFIIPDPTRNINLNNDAAYQQESTSAPSEATEKASKTTSMTRLNLVSTYPSFGVVLLPALEKEVVPVYNPPTLNHKDKWYAKALFSASLNQIYRSAFEVGRVKRLAESKNFSYGLGCSIEDGYSVSQDSVYYTTGIILEESRRDKDLDYMVSTYLSTTYGIKRKRFSASLGLRLSYALANKFNGYNYDYIIGFPGSSSGIGPRDYYNLWAGINRFGLDGSFAISYNIRRLEFSLLTSKRINSLIKDNNAASRKSNIPFQFGASITKHF